jgi:hypothetical protein
MAINQVSVVGPRSESREPAKEKKDWVERVIEGLTIAKGITGITNDITQVQKNWADKDAQDYALRGGLTGPQLAASDLVPGKEGDPGANVFILKDAKGEEVRTPLQKVTKQAPLGGSYQLVAGPDGKAVKKWLPNGGPDQPAFVKPDKAPRDLTVSERNELQRQYDKDPEVRKTKTVLDSFASTQKLLKNPTPASDQALVYNYMKALDPNSVVRETEAETAAALGGLQERAKAQYSKLAGEGMLSDAQRIDLAKQIKTLAETAAERQEAIDAEFSTLAGRRGVDTKDLRFVNRPMPAEAVAKGPKQKPGEAFAAGAPKVGTEEDGHIFQGGDPADPKNWKPKGAK